jgi:hypothetical protein
VRVRKLLCGAAADVQAMPQVSNRNPTTVTYMMMNLTG